MNALTPAESIRLAKDHLIIAMKVGDAIENDVWDAEVLKKHMLFKGKSEELYIPLHHRKVSTEELKSWAKDQGYYAAAMMAISTDEALEKTFGNNRLSDPDPERRAARCIMFLIRCTAAHTPLRPIWDIRWKYREQVFEVRSIGVTLDCPAVNGKPIKASDYGGWTKFVMLVDYCLKLVNMNRT